MRHQLRWFTMIRFSAALLVLFVAAKLPADERTYAMEYSRHFPSEGFDNLSLAPFGKGATSLLRQTEDGILISVPPGPDVKSVGFTPRFIVRGDFEITVTYQVKTWRRPREGAAVGPTLYISSEGERSAAAELGRLRRHGQEDFHTTFARAVIAGVEERGASRFPTKTQEGQLRLRRAGTALSFEVREDRFSGEFETLKTSEFDGGDITLVRMAVKRDDPDVPVEVLVKEFRIRADELPHLPSSLSVSEPLYRPMYHPPPQQTSLTNLVIFGAAIALLLAGGGGIVWWRWR
jgi:hypothetical protein